MSYMKHIFNEKIERLTNDSIKFTKIVNRLSNEIVRLEELSEKSGNLQVDLFEIKCTIKRLVTQEHSVGLQDLRNLRSIKIDELDNVIKKLELNDEINRLKKCLTFK